MQLHYVKGENNPVADAISRLPLEEEVITGDVTELGDICMEEEFLRRRVFEDNTLFPMNLTTIHQHQEKATGEKFSEEFKQEKHGALQLWTKDGRIVIPKTLKEDVMQWYHETLQHPGQQRMYNTLRQQWYWRGMKKDIDNMVSKCAKFQKFKKTARKKYGKLPAKDSDLPPPFHTVCVDLVGPWKIEVEQALGDDNTSSRKRNKNKRTRKITMEFKALTILDATTTLMEIEPYERKNSEEIAHLFDQEWLCRYPRPEVCIHDNGGEFMGMEFQEMLASYGIKAKPTTVKNPQANAIIERTHLTMADQLRMRTFTYDNWKQQLQGVCREVSWALRSTVHSTIQYTPGQLVFVRDMITQMKVISDWEAIKARKIESTLKTLKRENRSRIQQEYAVGEKVLITVTDLQSKLDQPTEGPFEIKRVNKNGTVSIYRDGYNEKINIRRLKPFREE